MGIPAQLQGHQEYAAAEEDPLGWWSRRLGPHLFLFFSFFFASLHSMWVLSSPTRDPTWTPAVKALHPTHWTTREFPWSIFQIRKRR